MHVHAAIANLALRADGADDRWRGIYGRALHMMRLWIAARVDREMEVRLIKRGLYMVPREDGNGSEVGGVSPQVAEMFSSRARGISPELDRLLEQYKQAHGRGPRPRPGGCWASGPRRATRRAERAGGWRAGGVDHGGDLDGRPAEGLGGPGHQGGAGPLSQVWRDVEAFGAGSGITRRDGGSGPGRAVPRWPGFRSGIQSGRWPGWRSGRWALPPESVRDIDIAVALAVTDSRSGGGTGPGPVDTSSLGCGRTGRASTGRRTKPGTRPPASSTSSRGSWSWPGASGPSWSPRPRPGRPWPGSAWTRARPRPWSRC